MQPARPRSDGWTPRRQLRFLEVLLLTRSVAKAAGAAGMSRESAHRLRKREPRGLFALAWDRALGAGRVTVTRITVMRSATESAQPRRKPAAPSTA